MINNKIAKLAAAVALSAIGSTAWSSDALAGGCQSGYRAWNTIYTQFCYNQFGGIVGAAEGEGKTLPPQAGGGKAARIRLVQGVNARIQTQDSFGVLINGCGTIDNTTGSGSVTDTSGCNGAMTFVVDANY